MPHLKPVASTSSTIATPPPLRYSLPARLGVALLSILLTAGAIELLLRGYVGLTGLAKSAPDEAGTIQALPGSALSYGLKPNLPPPISTNALGFRGELVEVAKPAGVRRILMLGDSITFGNSVEWQQTFSRVLEDKLNQRAGGRAFEVLNLGVSGYNTGQELTLLREQGLKFSPDLIVLNVCLNDSDPTRKVTPLGLRNDVEIRSLGDVNFRTVVQSSHLLTITKFTLLRLLEASFPGFGRRLNSPALVIDPRIHEQGWGSMKDQMRAIFALARARRIPLAMVIYPYSSQIGLTPEQMKPQQDLLAFADANGIPALEPSTAYVNQPEDMFIDRFIHLSPHGHRVIAAVIQEFLAARGLLPDQIPVAGSPPQAGFP